MDFTKNNMRNSMSKKLYGGFVGTKWGMCRNLKETIKATEAEMKKQGTTVGEVRAMNEPEAQYWDLTTFYACSKRVWGNDACPPGVLPVAVA